MRASHLDPQPISFGGSSTLLLGQMDLISLWFRTVKHGVYEFIDHVRDPSTVTRNLLYHQNGGPMVPGPSAHFHFTLSETAIKHAVLDHIHGLMDSRSVPQKKA